MQSSAEKTIIPKPKCKDCKMCQNCSESRCAACMCGNKNRKLSIQEQIELFNSLNRHLFQGTACKCAEQSEE